MLMYLVLFVRRYYVIKCKSKVVFCNASSLAMVSSDSESRFDLLCPALEVTLVNSPKRQVPAPFLTQMCDL